MKIGQIAIPVIGVQIDRNVLQHPGAEAVSVGMKVVRLEQNIAAPRTLIV